MARYKLEKRIPSTFIDKALLHQIEKYFIERIPKKLEAYVNEYEGKIEFEYSISIYDKYGKEEFETIDDLHRDKFANDIKRIVINLSTGYQLVEIQLSFTLGVINSYLDVDVRTENGKELSYGISREIEQLLEENKTIHFLFHNIYAWGMYGVFLITLSTSNIRTLEELPYHSTFVWFISLLGITYFLIREISPYSTFDTKNQENKNKFSKWLVNGLAGVFLFGVAATYLRGLIY